MDEANAPEAHKLLTAVREELVLPIKLQKQTGPVLYASALAVEAGFLWVLQYSPYMDTPGLIRYSSSVWFFIVALVLFELTMWQLNKRKVGILQKLSIHMSPRAIFFVFINMCMVAALYLGW